MTQDASKGDYPEDRTERLANALQTFKAHDAVEVTKFPATDVLPHVDLSLKIKTTNTDVGPVDDAYMDIIYGHGYRVADIDGYPSEEHALALYLAPYGFNESYTESELPHDPSHGGPEIQVAGETEEGEQ